MVGAARVVRRSRRLLVVPALLLVAALASSVTWAARRAERRRARAAAGALEGAGASLAPARVPYRERRDFPSAVEPTPASRASAVPPAAAPPTVAAAPPPAAAAPPPALPAARAAYLAVAIIDAGGVLVRDGTLSAFGARGGSLQALLGGIALVDGFPAGETLHVVADTGGGHVEAVISMSPGMNALVLSVGGDETATSDVVEEPDEEALADGPTEGPDF